MTDTPQSQPEAGAVDTGRADRPPASGASLLHRLLAGDEEAFRILVRRHHPGMVRLARNFVRTDWAAEEVTQQTWLAVLEGLPRFQARSSLKSWIFSILVNQARRRGVQDHRRERSETPPEGGPETIREPLRGLHSEPRDTGPERTLLAAELRRRLEALVGSLPEKQRLVLTLRDIQGWPGEGVCELLSVTPGHQRVLLHRARLRIRAALAPYLDSPTDREAQDEL